MVSFLSRKSILVLLAVVLVNAAAFGLSFVFGMPSPASGQGSHPRMAKLCERVLYPIYFFAYDRHRGQFVQTRVAIVVLLESIVIHLGAGWLSCKWKGKPLDLRNLFRFRAEEFRFSVRQLLVFVTFICVGCSIYAGWETWKMRTALHRQALHKMGIYDPDGTGYGFVGYYFQKERERKRVLFNMGTYQRWLASRGKSSTSDLPTELLIIKKVTQLSIEGATSLPAEIDHFSDLRILILQGCKLSTLPPEIGNLSELRLLDLQGNVLTMLPPEIGRLTKLEALDLRGNPITDSAVDQLASLKELRVVFRGNEMTEAGIAKLRQALPKCKVY